MKKITKNQLEKIIPIFTLPKNYAVFFIQLFAILFIVFLNVGALIAQEKKAYSHTIKILNSHQEPVKDIIITLKDSEIKKLNDSNFIIITNDKEFLAEVKNINYETKFITHSDTKSTIILENKKLEEVVITAEIHKIKRCCYSYCSFTTLSCKTLGMVIKQPSPLLENPLVVSTKLSTFPNPYKIGEFLNIRFKALSSEPMVIDIFTLDGKFLKQQNIKSIRGVNEFKIQLTNIIAQQYVIVKLKNKTGKYIGFSKLLVQ